MKDRTLECLFTYLAVTNKPSSSISSRNIAFSYSESAAIAAICRNFNADQSTLAPGPLDPELKRSLEEFTFPTTFWPLKDVRAHCYCASLVRTLFIGHARATSFSSARTDSKTQQNIERMTFALTWCANIFVGCSVTPTFFSADHFLFCLFPSY